MDAGTYRPGTVVTFTLDSHGRVDAESVSIDVDSYGYRRAARDAIHFPVGVDPATKERRSKSEPFVTEGAALAWIEYIGNSRRAVSARPRPPEYGESVMTLALRGLESRTLDPYLAGWRRRVVPALGHLAARMVTNGAVDRAVHAWIADECSRSTVKNSLAVLVRGAGAGRSGWRPPLCATSLAGVVTQLVTQQRAL